MQSSDRCTDVGCRQWMILVGAILILAGCGRSPEQSSAGDPQDSSANPEATDIVVAAQALASGNLPAAESAIGKHLVRSPDDSTGLELAGDIASARHDVTQSIDLYRSAIDNASLASAELYDKLGRQWMNVGSPYDAVDVLRESVRVHGDLAKVRADLAGLAASLGMVRDSAEHLRWLLRRGKGGLNELIMLADLNAPQTDEAICRYALKHRPADQRPLYALALIKEAEADWKTVRSDLARVTAAHRDFAPAWALYGRALVEQGGTEQGDLQAIERWQQNVPQGTDGWSDYWLAAGIWAEQNGLPEQAALAFWEAIRIDDCHGEALTHLAANLAQCGRREEAVAVSEHAANVNAMHDNVESLFSWRRNSQRAALAIADSMDKLGRPWEAEAWARASLPMTQELDPTAVIQHRELHAKLTSTTPWQLADRSVLSHVDLSDEAPFRWSGKIAASAPRATASPFDSTIRFVNEASERGLTHTCQISKRTPEASLWIYQSNAGGAGVIDYDLDGWPDLYLTMIDGEPLQRDSSPNHLYRNCEGSFVDTTVHTECGDVGFSQGVTVGDYNADGFPDLLVANIGANRLYRNNGDGTFRDVSDEVGLSRSDWTTSIAFADFDGDGRSDFFEVNYAAGESPFSQVCMDNEVKAPRSCNPLVFSAQQDRVWRGGADGRFSDETNAWLPNQEPGHGLGLVVGRIDDRPGIDVYVANDMTANQFWAPDVTADDRQENQSRKEHVVPPLPQLFSFREQAAVRGLAVSNRSQSQASMGIALGDGDLDGDLDIFLTHFTDDHNTLYEQIQPGTWFDRSSSVALAEPSMKMLAFGTEWIDADNDGWPELMVANGNVDDFTHQGNPLRMRPQLFRRNRTGVWQLADAEKLGPYFRRPLVGRALVTLDLNRDGFQDAVITHLFDPVAALVNRTESQGASIRLFLKGRVSDRDAVGTIVTASVGESNRTLQLTGGDGFQCSNERCVNIGLGNAAFAGNVAVRWTSGQETAIGDLQAGQDYLIVEGDAEPFRFSR